MLLNNINTPFDALNRFFVKDYDRLNPLTRTLAIDRFLQNTNASSIRKPLSNLGNEKYKGIMEMVRQKLRMGFLQQDMVFDYQEFHQPSSTHKQTFEFPAPSIDPNIQKRFSGLEQLKVDESYELPDQKPSDLVYQHNQGPHDFQPNYFDAIGHPSTQKSNLISPLLWNLLLQSQPHDKSSTYILYIQQHSLASSDILILANKVDSQERVKRAMTNKTSLNNINSSEANIAPGIILSQRLTMVPS